MGGCGVVNEPLTATLSSQGIEGPAASDHQQPRHDGAALGIELRRHLPCLCVDVADDFFRIVDIADDRSHQGMHLAHGRVVQFCQCARISFGDGEDDRSIAVADQSRSRVVTEIVPCHVVQCPWALHLVHPSLENIST